MFESEKKYYYVVIWESVNLEQQYGGEFGTLENRKVSNCEDYTEFSEGIKKIIINDFNIPTSNIVNIRFLNITLMNP